MSLNSLLLNLKKIVIENILKYNYKTKFICLFETKTNNIKIQDYENSNFTCVLLVIWCNDLGHSSE